MECVMRGGSAVAKGEVLYRLIFEGAGVGLCVLDTDGRILPNQAFAAFLGYQADELIHRRWQDLTHPADIESESAAIAALAAGECDSVRLVKRYLHKTGRTLWGETIVRLHRGADNTPAFMVGSLLDVGEDAGYMRERREAARATRVEVELRERLKELERWQDVMLDREERVAALKHEVNGLCVRLGEAARYATEALADEESEAGPFKVTANLPTIPEPNGAEPSDPDGGEGA
jgi:PAS domain S-box-containing protein